ncbi:flagellar motor switch protein FliM [Citrifermentans bemidjiense Bem]|uniref:Flagellar motor switch protein FliM n=1 Tax=Citrifermentans bemidjiense (strain ATCC BAA-1014 / DSM 16622 / JCM 12645 / Bem) TaxID=404380 RepID=B5EEN3_CITBB|nr:flagellar motor switch protein FliM [Citrifermentans bemidjiense]ACH40819.1 flagellar motor switch protein FliM [Citrifermentans bemidjiense Bem]
MEKLLTKEEIDALVAAVFDGTLVPENELAKEGPQAEQFDLLDIEAHRAIPNLDIVYDGFIRYNRVTMSNRLGRMVDIKKEEAVPYKFGDFLSVLPNPVCMAIYKMDPLKGAALIAFDATLVFTIVDSILGGSGVQPQGMNRLFTSIELRLVEKIVKDALADLEKAWAPLCPASMNLLRLEMNPRLVNIVPPEYQVVTMSMKIQIEETVGSMILAIPFLTIEPIRDKLKRGVQMDMMAVDPFWSYRLSEELMGAPMDLSVEMGGATISLSDLLHLTPGDTIMLEASGKDELTVKVGGTKKFMGIAGVSGGNKAVQITRALNAGGED